MTSKNSPRKDRPGEAPAPGLAIVYGRRFIVPWPVAVAAIVTPTKANISMVASKDEVKRPILLNDAGAGVNVKTASPPLGHRLLCTRGRGRGRGRDGDTASPIVGQAGVDQLGGQRYTCVGDPSDRLC